MYGDLRSSSLTKWWRKLTQKQQIAIAEDAFSDESHSIYHETIKPGTVTDAASMLFKSANIWKDKADEIYRFFEAKSVSCIAINENHYPAALSVTNDPPFILFCIGNKEILKNLGNCIGIVGTRHASYYAQLVTRRMIWEASMSKSVTCVSGLAKGIDLEVWKTASANEVNTVAVIPFFKNSSFYQCNSKQLIITEYPSQPINGNVKWCYVARNRIIAGLSEFCIVIEAPVKSGALITSAFSESYNREVYYLVHNLANRRARGGILHPPQTMYNPYVISLVDAMLRQNEIVAKRIMRRFAKHVGQLIGISLPTKGVKLHKLYKLYFSDFSEFLWQACRKNVKEFSRCVIELKRLNVIQEWRNVLLPNLLYVPGSWQNI
jgi:DNA processing protein